MNDFISCGIPLIEDYKKIISSNNFKEMEKFSDRFISRFNKELQEYSSKWVADPLHQWSRQWEYPYVYNKIMNIINDNVYANILDAGSGVTFFPYFLKNKSRDLSIIACDSDVSLDNTYQRINNLLKDSVNFLNADLRKLHFKKESFDIIYCISVIEHIKNYEAVIKNFHMLLKSGGTLIITFDISIDGSHDINIEKARELLLFFEKIFKNDYDISINLKSEQKISEIFTSVTANSINPKLLPWKRFSFSRIKSFIKDMRYNSYPPLLTVFCLTLKKRDS